VLIICKGQSRYWFLIDDYLSPAGMPICILAEVRSFSGVDVASFFHARYICDKYIVYETAPPTLDSTARIAEVGCRLEESEVIYGKKVRNITQGIA
jgi:hypothetical protein